MTDPRSIFKKSGLANRFTPFSLLLAAAMFTLTACLPAFLKKAPPCSTAGWEIWPGQDNTYGSYELKKDGLYYKLSARQDDTRETPSDGYAPGLMLSRQLHGTSWTLDLEAEFFLPPDKTNRFSCGVWLGDGDSRPGLGNFSSLEILLMRRQSGPAAVDDILMLTHIPKGRPFLIPRKAKVIRFERRETAFVVSYAMDRRKFTRVFGVDVRGADTVPLQKFFIAGYAGGEPGGAYAKFKSLKFNGKDLLRSQKIR